MQSWLISGAGGLLIGLAVWVMLIGLGRITGVSGIAATAFTTALNFTQAPQPPQPRESRWRFMFLFGLVAGGALFAHVFNTHTANVASKPWLIVAGLLVGFGSVIGSGCTSGHGVCGLGRRSLRSLVATLTFMSAGMLTVALLNYFQIGTP